MKRPASALLALALGAGWILALRYLALARPSIESVDFFYYVVNARDALHYPHDAPLARYIYFPGGYRFWMLVMRLFGEALPVLQWAHLAVLAANALLVFAVLARVFASPLGGMGAALIYIALASRLEGLAATTEPIATLFALAGLLCWGGARLGDSASWPRTLVFGAALGLAAWVKQQAGLLALGAAALVVTNVLVERSARHALAQLAAIPAAAAAAFLAAMLAEGHGLLPLRYGLDFGSQYDAVGSFADNAQALLRHTGYASAGMALAGLAWLATLVLPRGLALHREPWLGVLGFAVLAGAASLVQFATRPYLHYALLLAPLAAIATAGSAVQIARLSAGAPGGRFAGAAAVGVAALALVAPAGAREGFHAWPPQWQPPAASVPWHERPEVAADLARLRALVSPGEKVFLVPPRRNAVHFFLQSRSPSPAGYAWGVAAPYAGLSAPAVQSVIVLDRGVLYPDDIANGYRVAAQSLPALGFAPVAQLDRMSLWRRVR